MGSSPLTRGKPKAGVYQVEAWGLIPAHAGKTARTVVSSGWHRAHPRSRGENRDIFKFYEKPPGSSPLTRGKQRHEQPRNIHRGLIPAHAGKTPPLSKEKEL